MNFAAKAYFSLLIAWVIVIVAIIFHGSNGSVGNNSSLSVSIVSTSYNTAIDMLIFKLSSCLKAPVKSSKHETDRFMRCDLEYGSSYLPLKLDHDGTSTIEEIYGSNDLGEFLTILNEGDEIDVDEDEENPPEKKQLYTISILNVNKARNEENPKEPEQEQQDEGNQNISKNNIDNLYSCAIAIILSSSSPSESSPSSASLSSNIEQVVERMKRGESFKGFCKQPSSSGGFHFMKSLLSPYEKYDILRRGGRVEESIANNNNDNLSFIMFMFMLMASFLVLFWYPILLLLSKCLSPVVGKVENDFRVPETVSSKSRDEGLSTCSSLMSKKSRKKKKTALAINTNVEDEESNCILMISSRSTPSCSPSDSEASSSSSCTTPCNDKIKSSPIQEEIGEKSCPTFVINEAESDANVKRKARKRKNGNSLLRATANSNQEEENLNSYGAADTEDRVEKSKTLLSLESTEPSTSGSLKKKNILWYSPFKSGFCIPLIHPSVEDSGNDELLPLVSPGTSLESNNQNLRSSFSSSTSSSPFSSSSSSSSSYSYCNTIIGAEIHHQHSQQNQSSALNQYYRSRASNHSHSHNNLYYYCNFEECNDEAALIRWKRVTHHNSVNVNGNNNNSSFEGDQMVPRSRNASSSFPSNSSSSKVLFSSTQNYYPFPLSNNSINNDLSNGNNLSSSSNNNNYLSLTSVTGSKRIIPNFFELPPSTNRCNNGKGNHHGTGH